MSGNPGFDLLPEDDDLLNYFLSSDAGDPNLSMPNTSATAFSTFAVGAMPPSGSATADFAFPPGQPMQPTAVGQVSALQQLQAQQQLLVQQEAMSHSKPSGDATKAPDALNADNDEKRQRRLARNRESARQSRRRKKQYLELLEEKVCLLRTRFIESSRIPGVAVNRRD